MKLRRLSVNQFKRFTVPTQLDNLTDGLNLVIGPNELGKSTLLDALRAVLFERYNSRAQPIVALQNDRSGAAPVVELVFEVKESEYTLTKRFVNNPHARLQCPDGTLLEADAAEDELRSLLGFAQAGNRGATSETLGMWGVLWVRQGQSFGRPNLPGSALESLNAGLESEVSTVLGGRRGRELPQVIERRRSELVSETQRRPRGEYRDTLEQVSELERRLIEQQQQQQEMSETIEKLETAEERLKRLEDGGQDQGDHEELTQAREQLDEVMRIDLQLEVARSELQHRQGQLKQAQRARTERASRREELMSDQERLRQDGGRLEELQQLERESLADLYERRQAVTTTGGAVEAATQSEANWRSILDRVISSEELSALLRRQSDIDTAQKRLADARSGAEQIQITDESLQRLRQATDIADQANARLSVAATRVNFDIPSDRLAGVEVNGAPLTDPPTTLETVEQVEISIPERGRILIVPSVADRDQLLHEEREAQAELRAALSDAGAQSVAEAQILRDERRDLEAIANAAQEELKRLTPPGGTQTLQPRIDQLRESLEALPSQSGTDQLPQRDDAEAALRSAQTELQRARYEERLAREAVEVRADTVTELSVDVRTLKNSVDSQSQLIEMREERLQTEDESVSDQELAEATEKAELAVTQQQKTVSALEDEWSASTKTQLEARITRLESVIEQRENARVETSTEIVQLRARIEAHDSAGIEEAIAGTQRGLEQATRQRDRLERELNTLDLLVDALRAAESEARERYLSPVVNRVRPYLQMLFPNAEIGMDEHLYITGMSRREGYEESFDRLSMGTQEQIAVLVRLAFAEMLIDQGAPAAVVLDDALAFSDDQRMRLMFDILSHAAQRVQILVFTCREQLFEGLGAHQLHLASADPESLRSA